jgi:hypothetical protein
MLVVAEAHISRLADPELLGPWLYSLARAECCRRRAVQPLAPASTATSPSASASTSAGTLTVSPATVDLGTGSAGQSPAPSADPSTGWRAC